MSKKKIHKLIKYSSYLFVFIGVYVGIMSLHGEKNPITALQMFAMIAIFPLSLLSFFNHTVFHGQITQDDSPSVRFFEFEAGGANLAVALTLLLSYLCHANAQVTCYILLSYFIYLLVAAVCHLLFLGIKSFLLFIPLLALLLFFIIQSRLLITG